MSSFSVPYEHTHDIRDSKSSKHKKNRVSTSTSTSASKSSGSSKSKDKSRHSCTVLELRSKTSSKDTKRTVALDGRSTAHTRAKRSHTRHTSLPMPGAWEPEFNAAPKRRVTAREEDGDCISSAVSDEEPQKAVSEPRLDGRGSAVNERPQMPASSFSAPILSTKHRVMGHKPSHLHTSISTADTGVKATGASEEEPWTPSFSAPPSHAHNNSSTPSRIAARQGTRRRKARFADRDPNSDVETLVLPSPTSFSHALPLSHQPVCRVRRGSDVTSHPDALSDVESDVDEAGYGNGRYGEDRDGERDEDTQSIRSSHSDRITHPHLRNEDDAALQRQHTTPAAIQRLPGASGFSAPYSCSSSPHTTDAYSHRYPDPSTLGYRDPWRTYSTSDEDEDTILPRGGRRGSDVISVSEASDVVYVSEGESEDSEQEVEGYNRGGDYMDGMSGRGGR